MAQEWGGGEDAFSDNEEEGVKDTGTLLDHVICLIDGRENMFEKNDDGQTYFCMAMKVIHRILRTKIINSDKNMVGVTVFGTQKKTTPDSPHDHVFSVLNLDIPSAQGIRVIEKLSQPAGSGEEAVSAFAESQDSYEESYQPTPLSPSTNGGKNEEFLNLFGGSIPSDVTCPFKSALWSCTQSFIRNSGTAASNKRVFLFTNDDDPLRDAFDEQDRTVQVARDASDSGVDIQLFAMGTNFNVSKFYNRILVVDDEEVLGDKVIGCADIDALNTTLHKKIHRKRTLARLPLIISKPPEADNGTVKKEAVDDEIPYIFIQMKLVVTTAPTKIASIQLDGTCNEIVKAQTKLLCDTTGNYLDEYDIRTYMEVGGHNERAYLTKAEISSMKSWGSPGITILGFVDKTWLKPWHFVRSPYFLYPDESVVKGSTLAASSLLTTLLKENKIGLARFVRTAASGPQLLALIPQAEEINQAGLQVAPPGFHAVVLPFADDLRELPHVPLTKAQGAEEDDDDEDEEEEEEEAVVMERQASDNLVDSDDDDNDKVKLVSVQKKKKKKITTGLYSSKLSKAVNELVTESVDMDKSSIYNISNPILQKQWHMLQALALDESSTSSSSSSSLSSANNNNQAWNEKRDDMLQPNRKQWGSKYHLSLSFLDALPQGGLTSSPKKKAVSKRQKVDYGSDEEGAKKTKRAKPVVVEMTDEQWSILAANGNLETQTMPNLKEFLKKHGLPVSGKKADLVERVYDALSS